MKEEDETNQEEYPKINCVVCDRNIPAKSNSNINYCNDCDGNLCNNCNNNHNDEYPNHIKNNVKVVKMNPEEETNAKPLQCKLCNKNIDDKKPIQFCNTCNGNLCDKCGDNHYKTKPNHKISLFKYLKPYNDSNCNECGNKLNDNYKNCDNCNIPLCDRCGNEHKDKKPNHKIRVVKKKVVNPSKVEEDSQIPTVNCVECDKVIPVQNNEKINYCNDCIGGLCNECNNNHIINNPNHLIKQMNTILVKPSNEDKDNLKLNCDKCKQDITERIKQPIQNCSQCHSNLCDKCSYNHNLKFPKHKLNLIIYPKKVIGDNLFNKKDVNDNDNDKDEYRTNFKLIIPNDKCISCYEDLPLSDNTFINHCNNCLGNICESCIPNHINNNPNHNISNIKLVSDNEPCNKKGKCSNCEDNIKYLDNYPIYNCENCKGDLCDKCGNEHILKNQKHKTILVKKKVIKKSNIVDDTDNIDFDENLEDKVDNNDYNKENQDDIDNDKESVNICILCGKEGNNSCDDCKMNLCDDCKNMHQQKYPKHKITIRKYKPQIVKEIKKGKCIQCQKYIILKNNSIINYCDKCKGNLCDSCKNTHNNKYPKHNQLTSKIIYLDNDDNEIKDLGLFKCIVYRKNISDKINEPISNCYRCKGNLCQECSRSHNSEFPRHRLEYKLYLPNKEEPIDDTQNDNEEIIPKEKCIVCKKYVQLNENDSINHCNKCKGSICDKCTKVHSKNNPSHKTIPLRRVTIKKKKYKLQNA